MEKEVASKSLFAFADTTDRILMAVGTVAATGNGMALPIMIWLMGDMFNTIGVPDAASLSSRIAKVAIKYLYVGCAACAATFLQVSCWTIAGERQAARIRHEYMRGMLRQDISFFDTGGTSATGEVVEGITGSLVLVEGAIGEKSVQFVQHMSTVIGSFAMAFGRGWAVALVALASIPLVAILNSQMAIMIAKMTARRQAAYSEAAAVVDQTISSIRTVASFTGEEHAVRKYEQHLKEACKINVKLITGTGMGTGSSLALIWLGYGLGVWFGSKMILHHGYNGGDVITVISLVLLGSVSLGMAAPILGELAAAKGAAVKIFDTINRKPEIDIYDKGTAPEDIRGDIELRDVHFSYPSRPDEQVLKGLSLFVGSGKCAALIGESGSGKSTVISLIQRFYDPQGGKVLIDGVNLQEFQLRWIRGKMGLVSQEPALFSCSIRDNIAYGKSDATPEEICSAVELANASGFLNKLPQGLDTLVGENGIKLSGGQKQRIAIARAIVRNPRILLLDEATSALDTESERVVQEALDKATANRTTIIIAHRLSTVVNANTITVIHKGCISEQGSHSELISNPNGSYYKLVRLQETNPKGGGEEISYQKPGGTPLIDQSYSNMERTGELSKHNKSMSDQSGPGQHSQEVKELQLWRIASMGRPELPLLLVGVVGVAICGVVLPLFSVIYSGAIRSFYEPPHKLRKDISFWSLMYVTLAIVSLLANTAKSYFTVSGSKLVQRIRLMAFSKVIHMEIAWFDDPFNSSGAVAARLSSNAAAIRDFICEALLQCIQNTCTVVAGLTIAFSSCWQLALMIIGLLPLLGLNSLIDTKFVKSFNAKAKMMYEGASQIACESVRSIRTVASFCAEEKVLELYITKCQGSTKATFKKGLIGGVSSGIAILLLNVAYGGSFLAGSWLIQIGKATFSDVMVVFFVLYMAAMAISISGGVMPDSSKVKPAIASIFAILDREPMINSRDTSGMILECVQGNIEFNNVSFKYPTRPDVHVLKEFCLTVQSGKTVALVGTSGSGKSTIITLIQRFYNPDSGSIMLDGVEIQKLQLRWLRQQIGMVGQEPVLFNDTIRANIAYGSSGGSNDEACSESDIIAAAELANAHGFISGLSQGYDTLVGERGAQLSGGQKQRVAIARALVKKPKVLLLDEATSALDMESEQLVQEALDRATANRTTIVVAHRLSTIKGANLIAVVKNGVVAEQGTHTALLNIVDGAYATIVASNLLHYKN